MIIGNQTAEWLNKREAKKKKKWQLREWEIKQTILPSLRKWKWKGKLLSHVELFTNPWTIHPWNSPSQNSEGSLFLLQRIFLTKDSNLGLLHCRRILYQLRIEEVREKKIGALRLRKMKCPVKYPMLSIKNSVATSKRNS